MGIISSTNKTKSKYYEPSVDGLRALAVIIVILFHAGFNWIPGGYVGVDVFFVISGYLITGILYSGNEKGVYSYKTFILSRISRLYPALISTLILTLMLGFLVLSPGDLMKLGKTAIYTLFSASNFFFMNGAGYFDLSSETNLLLHTWSLAVEQQFYLVWPLIIVLSFRFGRRGVILAVCAIGLISLLSSQYTIMYFPTANYYMPWFRAFEFALGGSIYFIKKPIGQRLLNDILFLSGLLLVLYSSITFSKSTAFPGFNALIPALGACLIIMYCDKSKTGFILSNRLMVGIGVISYSVYLLHWPIMVIYKYYVFRDISTLEMAMLSIIPFVLAVPNYKYIENKYRRLNLQSLNRLSGSLFAFSLLILTASLIFSMSNGLPFRTNEYFRDKISKSTDFHIQQYGGAGYKDIGTYDLGDKDKENYSAVLMGDSFARQYASAIDKYPFGMKLITSLKDGCYFSLRMTEFNGGARDDDCPTHLQKALELSRTHSLPVIFSMRWYGYRYMIGPQGGSPKTFNSDEEYASEVVRNVTEIVNSFNGVKVVIIGSTPGVEGAGGVESCVTRPDYLPLVCAGNLVTKEKDNLNSTLNKNLKRAFSGNQQVLFIDPYDYMCTNGLCNTMSNDYKYLYSDNTHLSKDGAKYLWGIIGSRIGEFLR
ncbi:TPA: acyltransferase [Escherichia coli]|nr:acyltransferase [Escherichia coli]